MYQVMIKSPDGEEVELLASPNRALSDGAKLGAQALLDLLADEMDLEDGYEIILRDDETHEVSRGHENRL